MALQKKRKKKQEKAIKKVEVLPKTPLEEKSSKALVHIATDKEDMALELYVPSEVKDPLSYYLKQIGRYDLLSIEQERALTNALCETGDIEVAKTLVKANLRLVVKIAMEYRYAYQNLMDLIQEGNIGLMKAVSMYDPQKGAKLSYYASWWIRSYILRFILDNFRLVKIGTTSEQRKLFYNLKKEKDRLKNMGLVSDTQTVAKNLKVSSKSVALMEERMGPTGTELSLDKPQERQDGAPTYLLDSMESPEKSPDEQVDQAWQMQILKEKLGDFLGTLKERDKMIFKERLLKEIPPSLQSIADQYGVSRERIRQIEERLVNKLKVYMSKFIY